MNPPFPTEFSVRYGHTKCATQIFFGGLWTSFVRQNLHPGYTTVWLHGKKLQNAIIIINLNKIPVLTRTNNDWGTYYHQHLGKSISASTEAKPSKILVNSIKLSKKRKLANY